MLGLDAMRGCFEHHMNFDGSGYPPAPEWPQGTVARVVALADCFDAMTAHRAYAKRPFTAFEALRHLMGGSRTQFDPAVVWALVRTVGLYPAGTVMLVESGHLVLSMSPNPDDLCRPHCRVLMNPDGTMVPEEGAETWSPMPADNQVARVLAPEEYEVDTTSYIAA